MAGSAKRVLIVEAFGRDVMPFNEIASGFRTTLALEMGQPIDVYEAPLDLARFSDSSFEKPFFNFLEQRFADRPPDLIVPIGGSAARFATTFRDTYFKGTPILFAGTEPRSMPENALKTNATLVTQRVDVRGMVEDILQLQPETTNIAVIFGNSPLEKFWAQECRREWQPFSDRVRFSWLNDLPLAQIVERTSSLPPRSFILYALMVVDADGVPYDKGQALSAIYRQANAPVYCWFKSQFGSGIVGGRLHEDYQIGVNSARRAIRILRGEIPPNAPPEMMADSEPIYDGRELRRWNIDPRRLPPGSRIEFLEPTFWDRYRWHVAGIILFCGLQTALIIGLVVNRAQRRNSENSAALVAELSSKFVNLPADEVDREIQTAQQRVCEAMGLDVSALWQWTEPPPRLLRMTQLYGYFKEPVPDYGTDAEEVFPWSLRQLLDKKPVLVSSLEALPPEASRDREIWKRHGVKSILKFPLSAGGERLIGTLSFCTTRRERDWPDNVVRRLQTVAHIFSSALARQSADHALRQSEERYRSIALNLPGIVYQFFVRDDGSRGVYYLDGRVKELCGLDPAPLDTFFERFIACIAPELRQSFLDSIDQAVRNNSCWENEIKFTRPNGDLCYIRGISRPQRRDKEVVFSGVLRDITERKLLDIALAESELRYRMLFESAPVGIVLIGPDGHVRAANPMQARLYGYDSPEQLAGMHAPLFVAEPERQKAGNVMAALLAGEDLPERHYTVVRRDGSQFIAEVTSVVLRVAGQGVIGYLCLTRDVTALMRGQEVLRKSEQKFRELYESMRDAFVTFDSNGHIRDFNSVYQLMLGYTSEELRSLTHRDITPERWHAFEAGIIRDHVLVRGYSDVYEKEYRRKDGTVFAVELRAFLIRDEGGEFAAMWAIVRDVTERKRAEQELQRHRSETAHVSRVSTMGALTASLAHELNQPLSAILSNAQAGLRFLTASTPDLTEVRGALEDIARDTRRAGEVIRQVRALVRKDEPTLRPLDINHLITEVFRLLHSDIVIKKVQVRLDLDEGLRFVSGDNVQLQQVVLNLMLNAFDAMKQTPEKERIVTVRSRRHDVEFVRVEVSDRGTGISPEKLLKLFEPFRSSKRDGLGLGLSISHSIVEAHRGRLWADNNPRNGATFYFTLPVQTAETTFAPAVEF